MLKKKLYRIANPLVGRYLNSHNYKNDNNVFIFSTARSGSTILMELFYTQSDFSYRNEPFHPGRLKMLKSPIKPYSWGGVFGGQNKSLYLQHLKNSVNGKSTAGGPTRFWEEEYDFFTNRLAFKILRRKDLIWYFSKNLDGDFIFLIRHPIPTALSWLKNDYEDNIKYIINNSSYMSFFTSKIQEYIRKIIKSGTKFEKMIIEWCLENKPVLEEFDEKKCSYITYEEMVKYPERLIDFLMESYGVQEKNLLLEKLLSPSKSTKYSDKKTSSYLEDKEGKKDRNYLISKWEDEISSKQIEKADKILNLFKIDAYESKKLMPVRRGAFLEET